MVLRDAGLTATTRSPCRVSAPSRSTRRRKARSTPAAEGSGSPSSASPMSCALLRVGTSSQSASGIAAGHLHEPVDHLPTDRVRHTFPE